MFKVVEVSTKNRQRYVKTHAWAPWRINPSSNIVGVLTTMQALAVARGVPVADLQWRVYEVPG